MWKRLDAGLRVGEYLIEAKLGEGAFGEVWSARHRVFEDVRVALKVPRDARSLARIREEAFIARRLDIDGAVKLLGLDADHDPPYIAFELVEGESLRDLLRRGPLPWERAVAIARRVLGVLQAAHDRRIVHRDVKPENILLDASGRAFLADFGLAAELEDARTITLTSSLGSGRTHAVVGTLRYMAPEQKDPERPVDHRADLYAMGLVLFEMLTGTLPEGGEVPSDLVPGLDPGLDALFRRCYARLERRCATAAEAVAALDAIVDRRDRERRERSRRAEAETARLARVSDVAAAPSPGAPRPAPRSASLASPALIPWEEARALLRVTDRELLGLVDAGTIARVADRSRALAFRRGDVVELKRRLRRVSTGVGLELRVVPASGTAREPARPAVALRPPAPRPLEARSPRAAGLGVRAAALGVDATCVAVFAALAGDDVFAAPSVILAHAAGGPHLASTVAHSPCVLGASGLLFAALVYFTVLTALFGRTLGKWLLGIRVVGVDGEPLGLGRSAARAVGSVVSVAPLGIGFLSAALDPEARAFHDVVAESRVVYE